MKQAQIRFEDVIKVHGCKTQAQMIASWRDRLCIFRQQNFSIKCGCPQVTLSWSRHFYDHFAISAPF